MLRSPVGAAEDSGATGNEGTPKTGCIEGGRIGLLLSERGASKSPSAIVLGNVDDAGEVARDDEGVGERPVRDGR